MAEATTKDSQASTQESKETKVAPEDKLYPGSGEDGNETSKEKTTRELGDRAEKVGLAKDATEDDVKTAETKAETATKELSDRAEKVGLKIDATEDEVKVAEKEAETKAEAKKKEDEKTKISVTELHDAAISAVEKWQANPTPENKKLADKAVADAKKGVEDEKSSKIEYDVKLPENSLLPKERVEEIVTIARERGFSNEVAQFAVDREEMAVAHVTKEAVDKVDQTVNVDWPLEAKDDKEIGGDDFVKNAELAKRVFIKFAPPEFVKFLDPKTKENPTGTGYGNHPGFLKTFVRLGKVMSDDQLLLSKAKSEGDKDITDVLYGPEKKDDEKTE